MANAGINIGFSGDHKNHDEYNELYDRWLKIGDESTSQFKIGQIYKYRDTASVKSHGTTKNYEQYYGDWYEENFPQKK